MSLMFPIYVGLKYNRAKKRNFFISLISLISVFGIALGATVLITVLSVMNGFDYEIHNKIFAMAEHVKIGKYGGQLIGDWKKLGGRLSHIDHVVSYAPFVIGQGMVSANGEAQGVMFKGVLCDFEKNVSNINTFVESGSFYDLREGSFNVLVGRDLSMKLGVDVGDKILLMTMDGGSVNPLMIAPRMKRLTVAGIFHVQDSPEYDSNFVFMNLGDVRKILQIQNDEVSGIRVKVDHIYSAPLVTSNIKKMFSQTHQRTNELVIKATNAYDGYFVTDWTKDYETYFKAIKMEKSTMFVVLMFIIAIAAFNLVSSLVMTVTDKRSDIAILRTLGASKRTIMMIFIVQGCSIGFIGSIVGVIGGILLSINAPRIVSMIERIFSVHFISSSIYFVDYLPSRLVLSDVIMVGIISMIMSICATIYPALRASKINPAEALRYE